ncbi:hypothetical protein F4677DRAFT_165259 [Hypoxylon crocopeplum]|nr:hypothetical protein F4677DRAFT_165259 [Hypoxylon crocopeplum]
MASSSRESRTYSSRSSEGERKHRKRYSLRIEFLDDEENELDRSSGTASRESRRSTDRSHADAESRRPEQANRRRKAASTSSSTAGVVGTGDRRDLPQGPRPAAADRDPRPRTGARDMRASVHGDEDYFSAVGDHLSEIYDRNMSMRDRDGQDLLERFERQMSMRDRDGNNPDRRRGPHKSRQKPAYRPAATQTNTRAHGSYASFSAPMYPPLPVPGPPFTQYPGPNLGFLDGTVQDAYFHGFREGQRLAAQMQQPYIPAYPHPHPPPPPPPPQPSRPASLPTPPPEPGIQPPQPLSNRGRDQPSGNQQQQQQQQQQWRLPRSIFPSFFGGGGGGGGGAREQEQGPRPRPRRSSESRSSVRSHRHRR